MIDITIEQMAEQERARLRIEAKRAEGPSVAESLADLPRIEVSPETLAMLLEDDGA